jgi:hypothetical protein
METYLTNLARLKELLQTADNFGDIIDFYFDDLDKDPAFVSRSKPVKHPEVMRALKTITAEIFKREDPVVSNIGAINVTRLVLLRLGKHPFYHGTCLINGRPVSLLYFEDIDMGLVSVAARFPYMEFARFTCYRVKPLDPKSIFTPGNRTPH